MMALETSAILNLAKMRLKYHKIMISANVISTGYGILESIKIHIENCCKLLGFVPQPNLLEIHMAYNMTKAGVSKKAFLPFLDTPP